MARGRVKTAQGAGGITEALDGSAKKSLSHAIIPWLHSLGGSGLPQKGKHWSGRCSNVGVMTHKW